MTLLGQLLSAAAIVLATSSSASAAAGQESLSAARDLYARAAYEDALALLDRLHATQPRADDGRIIEQYRAFCLLALGRAAEADHAIESVVREDPLYRPSRTEISPRLRAAFSDVRRRVLPALVQQRYEDAKAAYDAKAWAGAASGFQLVLDVLADPELHEAASQPPLADLKTLAEGFRDLSKSAAAPPPTPPPPPQPEPPPPAPAPVDTSRVYAAGYPGVVPPAIVRQNLPPFPIHSAIGATQGSIEVVIDERGGVESAVMRMSLGSAYDRMVVAAARDWQFKPATLRGTPIKFRKIVQINVQR